MVEQIIWDKFDIQDVTKDIAIGIGLVFIFIILNVISPDVLSIGLPVNLLTSVEGFILFSLIIAPFAEELFFRGFLYSLFTIYFNPVVAGVLQALAFSLLHYTAYGVGLETAFVGAFIFGIMTWYIARERKNLLPAIILHMGFNLFLVGSKFVLIA